MDQIYREYSEKYKHILHYAGIMKKENVLFENQEIIVPHIKQTFGIYIKVIGISAI